LTLFPRRGGRRRREKEGTAFHFFFSPRGGGKGEPAHIVSFPPQVTGSKGKKREGRSHIILGRAKKKGSLFFPSPFHGGRREEEVRPLLLPSPFPVLPRRGKGGRIHSLLFPLFGRKKKKREEGGAMAVATPPCKVPENAEEGGEEGDEAALVLLLDLRRE